jgi:hypothetical protein
VLANDQFDFGEQSLCWQCQQELGLAHDQFDFWEQSLHWHCQQELVQG